MTILSAQNLTKSFGERVLFQDLTFQIEETSKIGLVGANGVGKTTLFRVLCGLEDAEGSVVRSNLLKIGYMEQTPPEQEALKAFDYVLDVFRDLIQMEGALEDTARAIEHGDGELDALVAKQSRLHDAYLQKGGMTFRARTRSMLLGLGFLEAELSFPLSNLSGGQKTRLSLARALLSDAGLLLLDEPTNHLDIDAIDYLEGFLRDYNRAFLLISHDRYFLDRVTNRTFELEHARMTAYNGNYTVFLQKKEEARVAAQRQYENTMKEIKRIEGIIEQQRQWNRERNIRTAEHKQKSIDRLQETLVRPEDAPQSLRFSFPAARRSGDEVLTVQSLAKSFGEKKLFSDVSFALKRGDRAFLLGPNGCGKSTIYHIIKGALLPDDGTVTWGSQVDCAYYDQNRSDFTGSKTVMDELWDHYPRMTQTEVRSALAAFLFCGDDVFKTVDCLSGGEKARLALLIVMLEGANVLLLDEPTNHLDAASREMLEEALLAYGGTMFIISHDRYLINKLSTKLLAFENGTVQTHLMRYEEYAEYQKTRTEASEAQRTERQESEGGNDYKRQKELESRRRRMAGQIARLETAIEASEAEVARLEAALSAASSDYAEVLRLGEELCTAQQTLEQQMHEWEELSAQQMDFE